MLSSLSLSSFKAFDEVFLPLGALTLLSGVNSAGKSTILQAISLVRQSFDAGMLAAQGKGELLLNGGWVELGTIRDLHCEYSQRKPATIQIEFGIADEENPMVFSGPVEDLEATFLRVSNSATTDSEIRDLNFLSQPFNYLRADRISPESIFPRSYKDVRLGHSLGARGEYTVHYLTEYGDAAVNNSKVISDQAGPSLKSQVSLWMEKITPGVRLEPDKLQGTNFVTIRFGFGSYSGLTGSSSYRPTHVGFGLTYTLPIIVALVATPPGGVVLIENPEAHVHPRGQAALGELMCRAADGGVQVLLETHSDHVLNGVRLAVKRKLIDRHSLQLHFFSRRNDGTMIIESPVVEAEGRLSRWPEGFFDQWDVDLDQLID